MAAAPAAPRILRSREVFEELKLEGRVFDRENLLYHGDIAVPWRHRGSQFEWIVYARQ